MMNPLVSIIIPTKNSVRTIKACIESVQNQSYKRIEILVVDNHSSDTTEAIAASMGTAVFIHGNERSRQRNKGAKESSGDFLLFVDSDMELSPTVIQECVDTMNNHSAIQAINIPEQSFGEGFWATCKTFERSFYVTTPWMQAVRFFQKSAYESIGGFDETLIGAEDFDAHNRIIKMFGAHAISTSRETIYHNEGSLTLNIILKKKYYYGKSISTYSRKEHNKKQFLLQGNPLARIRIFIRELHTQNIVLVSGTVFMKIAEFFAGGLGYIVSMITYKKHMN